MRSILVAAALAVSQVHAAWAASSAPAAKAKAWVCPMAEHPKEFAEAGSCPICGMGLVEKENRLRVAVLLFDGAEIIDYAAPFEVFGQAGAKVFTVAREAAVHSVFGLAVKPDYDLEHAPPADVLLIPGGGIDAAINDPRVMDFIRARAVSSRYVLSVCNGAFFLAKAGLLDGLAATTTASNLDRLREAAPRTRVVRDRRFVDNGKVITSGGLSAGIDGALHVVEREYGRVRAEEVARDIEYRWEPDSTWARGNLADSMLPDVRLPDGASWQKLVNRGDTDRWEVRGRLTVDMPADDFLDLSARQIIARGWKLKKSARGRRSFYKKDADGRSWLATLSSAPDDEPATFVETMTIEKVR
jgi:putative intracellular protease/amidase